MPQAQLNREPVEINDGRDSIVVITATGYIPGGRALDMEGFAADIVKAGHIIITEDATGKAKPMPVNAQGNGYGNKPSGWSYAGVLRSSVSKRNPQASILTQGQVNAAASPFKPTETMKSALTGINFLYGQ